MNKFYYLTPIFKKYGVQHYKTNYIQQLEDDKGILYIEYPNTILKNGKIEVYGSDEIPFKPRNRAERRVNEKKKIY